MNERTKYYTELIPITDYSAYNNGMSPCPTSELMKKYGKPLPLNQMSDRCKMPNKNTYWYKNLVTENVGPFVVTGNRLFVRQLKLAFAKLGKTDPKLYALIGNMGCICVRFVRGSTKSYSNHSLGLAIDLTVAGILDARGDGKIQRGMQIVYSVFKEFGIYSGLGFGKNNSKYEDAMHLEASEELINQWIKEGKM